MVLQGGEQNDRIQLINRFSMVIGSWLKGHGCGSGPGPGAALLPAAFFPERILAATPEGRSPHRRGAAWVSEQASSRVAPGSDQ